MNAQEPSRTISVASLKEFLENKYREKNTNLIRRGVSTSEILIFAGSQAKPNNRTINQIRALFEEYEINWTCVSGFGWLPRYEIKLIEEKQEVICSEQLKSDQETSAVQTQTSDNQISEHPITQESTPIASQASDAPFKSEDNIIVQPVLWGKTKEEILSFLETRAKEKFASGVTNGISVREICDWFNVSVAEHGSLIILRQKIKLWFYQYNLPWSFSTRGLMPHDRNFLSSLQTLLPQGENVSDKSEISSLVQEIEQQITLASNGEKKDPRIETIERVAIAAIRAIAELQ